MKLGNLCLNCLKEKPNPDGPCPYCGFDNANYVMRKNQLPPHTILNGRYIIGRVINVGGFGIVYYAKDLFLDVAVAVKELFPHSMMLRNTEVYTGEISTTYLSEKEHIDEIREKFIREARILAKHRKLDGIVEVTDLFEENGTAYLVMEYLEGIDLKEYIENKGRLTFEETIKLLFPVMKALKILHAEGIIHRDISPDNIMLLKDGTVKLLDFGGVKNTMNKSGKQSEMVMIKRGYTPLEQYSTNGDIGPWTDIYALCATIYKCITGETLPEPIDIMKHGMVCPSQKGIKIPVRAEKTLLKGLEINTVNRIRDIQELIDAFYLTDSSSGQSSGRVSERAAGRKSESKPSKRKYAVIAGAVAAVLILAGITIVTGAFGLLPKNKKTEPEPTETVELTSTETPAPTSTPVPTEAPDPTSTPVPTEAPDLTSTSVPTETPVSTETETPSPTTEPTVTSTSSQTETADRGAEKLGNSEVGDYIIYGAYEQDNNLNNGKEEIEWKVLEKEDDRIFVISKYGLENKPYFTKMEPATWETSSIRKWLNDEFINSAFTESEKSRILTVTVTADKNSKYNTDSGNDTQDKLFLLSSNEARTYFSTDKERVCKVTPYAVEQGANAFGADATCWWWLRSPGENANSAAIVSTYGSIDEAGDLLFLDMDVVRPAMWIDLKS